MCGEPLSVPRAALGSFILQVLATAMISIGYIASLQFHSCRPCSDHLLHQPIMILIVAPIVEGTAPSLLRFATALYGFAGLVIAFGFSFNGLDWRASR